MIGALISAFILIAIIRGVLGEETSFGAAFLASFLAAIVSSVLVVVACAPIESLILQIIIIIAINFIVTAIAVQLICSTDLRGVLKVTGIYIGIVIAFYVMFEILGAFLVSGPPTT